MFCGLSFCFLENYVCGKMGLQVIEVHTDQRKGLGGNALEHPSLIELSSEVFKKRHKMEHKNKT